MIFLIDAEKQQVLLGLKKRGYGKDKWNGYGGKVNENESFEEAAIREFFEETTVQLQRNEIQKVADLTYYAETNKDGEWEIAVFTVPFQQHKIQETEEMKPGWFPLSDLPAQAMWIDQQHWLPALLTGNTLKGTFWFDAKEENLLKHQVEKTGRWS